MPPAKFQIVNLNQTTGIPCPCGSSRRAFTNDSDLIASLHAVDISVDAQTHYHKKLTEIYYILAGNGQMELDGELFDVEPGCTILIKPGCRHRAVGQMKILNVSIPAFDPNDEWFD